MAKAQWPCESFRLWLVAFKVRRLTSYSVALW